MSETKELGMKLVGRMIQAPAEIAGIAENWEGVRMGIGEVERELGDYCIAFYRQYRSCPTRKELLWILANEKGRTKLEIQAWENTYNTLAMNGQLTAGNTTVIIEELQKAVIERKGIDVIQGLAKKGLTADSIAEASEQLAEISGGGGGNTSDTVCLVNQAMTTPIDIQGIYDKAPETVKVLTKVLCAINPQMSPVAHFFTSISLFGAVKGKRIVAENFGREYYANLWTVVLSPTASNKSAIHFVERAAADVIHEDIAKCPYDVMRDRFTMSFAYSELGGIIGKKDWALLCENEQIAAKAEVETKCKGKKARIIFADEFSYTFSDVMSSGSNGSKTMGQTLQLAENDSVISGNTATDGYRAIHDCCLSIIGFTQTDTWYRMFDTATLIESGLIGRFLLIDVANYGPLNVGKIDTFANMAEAEAIVRQIIRCIIKKLPAEKQRIYPNANGDVMGQIMDEITADKTIAACVERGVFPLDKLRGKIIYQALKICMAIHGTFNAATFRQFAMLLTQNAIKVCSATIKSETDIIAEKVLTLLHKAKGGRITTRDIIQRNYKVGPMLVRKNEAREIAEHLRDTGKVTLRETRNGAYEITLR